MEPVLDAQAPPDRLPEGTLGVAALSQRINAAINAGFTTSVWVAGEVMISKRGQGPNMFFELVERSDPSRPPDAKISVAVIGADVGRFQAALRRSDLAIGDGLAVRIQGRVELWAKGGSLSFRATAIDVEYSVVRLAADRGAVLRKLAAEGLTVTQAALHIPVMPLRIVLITSDGSAAYHDFTHHIIDSGYAFEVCSINVRVQGTGAPAGIVAALHAAASPLWPTWRPDVVVVVRGGGARTDLTAFDTEEVARAVATCPVPVITGIGHDIDVSVADQVAHRAAKTPTDAAAVLVERAAGTARRVETLYGRASVSAMNRFDRTGDSLTATLERGRSAAARLLATCDDRLDFAQGRLLRAGGVILDRAEATLHTTADRVGPLAQQILGGAEAAIAVADATVSACRPERVLARGYSITRTATGAVVRDGSGLADGDVLVTTVELGTIRSTLLTAPAARPRSEPEAPALEASSGRTTKETNDEH